VEYFDATFLGVTGDNAQIGNLAGQLGAAYEVAITPGMENYPVYHTARYFWWIRKPVPCRVHAAHDARRSASVSKWCGS